MKFFIYYGFESEWGIESDGWECDASDKLDARNQFWAYIDSLDNDDFDHFIESVSCQDEEDES